MSNLDNACRTAFPDQISISRTWSGFMKSCDKRAAKIIWTEAARIWESVACLCSMWPDFICSAVTLGVTGRWCIGETGELEDSMGGKIWDGGNLLDQLAARWKIWNVSIYAPMSRQTEEDRDRHTSREANLSTCLRRLSMRVELWSEKDVCRPCEL